MLLIDGDEVERAANMKTIMNAVENAFSEVSRGSVIAPRRSQIQLNRHNGTIFIMPSYIEGAEIFAAKIVSSHPDNPDRFETPTISGYIMLIDPKNGEAIALMDGKYITALRTGAVSGLAIKYMARKESSRIGMIGTGIQARTQLIGAKEVLDHIDEVCVFDKIPLRSATFAAEMSSELGLDIIKVKNNEDAVCSMDVVIEATTSMTPVFDGDWLKEGAHINSVGWMGPSSRQLDDATIRRSRIVVDTLEGALAESGDLIIPLEQGVIEQNSVRAELSEVISGTVEGRTDDKEITLFKAVGFAPADAAAAKAVYDVAVGKGIGKMANLN